MQGKTKTVLFTCLLSAALLGLLYARTTPYFGVEAIENLQQKQGISIFAALGIILALYTHFQTDLKH